MFRNILIKGGHVIDPANGIDTERNVYICGDRLAADGAFTEAQADLVYNAEGLYVFPGLIDFHAHVFDRSTEIGINPDVTMLCQGVTTVVDAGSAGVSTMQTFLDNIVFRAFTNVQAYLEFCPCGMPTMKFHENFDPKLWDKKRIAYFLSKYSDVLLGMKIRMSAPILGELGFACYEEAVHTAHELGTTICVHTTNPAGSMEQAAGLLEKGDVLAHCFHGTGNSIIGSDGKVKSEIRAAQKRGVIMDAANGGNHWNFTVAEKALADGFRPDIISTDLTCKTIFKDPVFGLPYVMSKYLLLGMPLYSVIKATTETPASLLHGSERRGTLSAGCKADVAVFSLEHKDVTFSDTAKNTRVGHELLVPALTVREGELVYRSMLH